MYFISVAHAGVITDAPSISTAGMNVLNFLLSVAEIVAIISLVLAGILYFVSAGDEKKMEVAKKAAMYSILGIITVMGGMILIRMIGQFFQR